jgi:hypothetical protein
MLDEEEDLELLAWPFQYRPNITVPPVLPHHAATAGPILHSATPAGDGTGGEDAHARPRRGLERSASARHLLPEADQQPSRLRRLLPLLGAGREPPPRRPSQQLHHGGPPAVRSAEAPAGAGVQASSSGEHARAVRAVAVVLQEDAETDAAEQMLET